MFYLSFLNQIQLLILLIFSSYIFISSITIRLPDPGLKIFGLSFSIPIVLGCYSFLVAPVNMNLASLFLDFSWISLILMITILSMVKRISENTKFLFTVVFLIPVVFILTQNQLAAIQYKLYTFVFTISVILVQLTLMIYYFLSKAHKRISIHLGILMISGSFMLFSTTDINVLWASILAAAGFIVCSYYFYRHSFGIALEENRKINEELKRINTSVHLEVVRRVEEIERSNRKLLEISKTDSMTGLYVKSVVLKNLDSMIEKSHNTQISLLMFDIDKFKDINDNLGHQIGDKCIKALSAFAQSSFRKEDVLGRYGGDEFIVLLPDTPTVKAYIIADRFRQLIQNKTNPSFTISVGISTYPHDSQTTGGLIETADKALYISKQRGRNRVTNYSSIE